MASKGKSANSGKWRRFRHNPRAMISLVILVVLYAVSLCTELICSSEPLYLKVRGRRFFPFLSFVSEKQLFGEGADASPDWSRLESDPRFSPQDGDCVLFAPIRSGTSDIMRPEDFAAYRRKTVLIKPDVKVARCDVDADLKLTGRHFGCEAFFDTSDLTIPLPALLQPSPSPSENGRAGRPATAAVPEPLVPHASPPTGMRVPEQAPEAQSLSRASANADLGEDPADLSSAVSRRLANLASPAATFTIGSAKISLTEFRPRSKPPKSVRLRIEEVESESSRPVSLTFDRNSAPPSPGPTTNHQPPITNHQPPTTFTPASSRAWASLSPETRAEVEELLNREGQSSDFIRMSSMAAEISVSEESVTWPFRPVPGHPMGIDGNGRDVFACILSGTRTAMTFGIVLVAWAMLIGIVAGAVQGYFGGWVDMSVQRFIEIWSSLPFLYVMILVGDVCGRSFALLLFCYGLFNWIGVSYYVRAEFLRLRKRPFVEAAKCLGLPSRRIIMRHILPNALTPVITLLPFSLVGAIASISALDFLGFGLPPLTPSWGELLQQAQENVHAWWLILYPSAMLFFVMLFAVFVGEGLRDAFDPKPAARYR